MSILLDAGIDDKLLVNTDKDALYNESGTQFRPAAAITLTLRIFFFEFVG